MSDRAERRYRRLAAWLLPSRFRREAEGELVELFLAGHARARGPRARLACWTRALIDLAATAWAERCRRAVVLVDHDRGSALGRTARTRVTLGRRLERLALEARLATRRLGREPGWTLLTAAVLGLGIAAAVVAWVLVRDVLLRPLPFRDPDRLVRLIESSASGDRMYWPSYPNIVDWRESATFFDGVGAAAAPERLPVLLDRDAILARVGTASRGLFETLGTRAAVGRLFTHDENRPGGPAVAMVSWRFWKGRFASRPLDRLGMTIGTDRYAVVGVLPPDFRFLGVAGGWQDADVWTPMERSEHLGGRGSHGYHTVARVGTGLTLDEARAAMNGLASRFKRIYGDDTQADTVVLTPLLDVVVGRSRASLELLLAAAGAVLFVACLNLAAAILAQGLGRGRELSIRLALGARRADVRRQFLTEAAVLALPGAALGAGLAAAGIRLLRTLAPGTLPRLDEITLDPAALAVAAGLALVTAVAAALVPSLALSGPTLAGRLRAHGATTGTRRHQRLWHGFVAAQVALTLLLVASAGLLVRSFLAALDENRGYRPARVTVADVSLPESRYAEPAARRAFYEAALARLRAEPGVEAAGITSILPNDTTAWTSTTWRDPDQQQWTFAGFRLVDEGYFAALGIPLLQGALDALGGDTGLIDRAIADKFWADGSPLGDRVASSMSGGILTVGGVVGSIREWNFERPIGVVYADYRTRPQLEMHLVARVRGTPAEAAAAMRDALGGVDPLVPATIEPLERKLAADLSGRRLLAAIAAGFGVIALLLASAGVHAMVAFAVRRQARESAIRLALGAKPDALRRRVVAQGLAPAVAGLAIGFVALVPARSAIASQLVRVHVSDPVVLSAATLALALAALLAAAIPARRAARVDPIAILREE